MKVWLSYVDRLAQFNVVELVFDIRLADFEKHFNEFLCVDVNNKNSS